MISGTAARSASTASALMEMSEGVVAAAPAAAAADDDDDDSA